MGHCLTIGVILTNNIGDSQSNIALTIDFRDCPLIGIVWTIDVWGFSIIGNVQTNELGDCLLIEVVLANDFIDRLSTNWNCLSNWFHLELSWLSIEFKRALLFLKAGSYLLNYGWFWSVHNNNTMQDAFYDRGSTFPLERFLNYGAP